jgi:uncharacterized membrane protein
MFHLVIVGGFLLFVGMNRNNNPEYIYNVLLLLGIVIFFYHIYKAVVKIHEQKSAWVNSIHIFIIAPTLLYVGYNKKETKRLYYEILLLLGFSAIGYHGYYALQDIGILSISDK